MATAACRRHGSAPQSPSASRTRIEVAGPTSLPCVQQGGSSLSYGLTPADFAKKWTGSTRTERAASQDHFIDLCRMLGVPTPNEADPTGDTYAFEKGVGKVEGGERPTWYGWPRNSRLRRLARVLGRGEESPSSQRSMIET